MVTCKSLWARNSLQWPWGRCPGVSLVLSKRLSDTAVLAVGGNGILKLDEQVVAQLKPSDIGVLF